MTFECADLERALASDDVRLAEAARVHAEQCADCRAELALADALSAAARTLHREWEGPNLWRAALAHVRDQPARTRWWLPSRPPGAAWRLAAAAALVLAVASATWVGWRVFGPGERREDVEQRPLLDEAAVSEIERAEAEYVRAIDALARTAPAAKVKDAASPLLVSLRERLLTIDAAIADCRAEIERNRFNAHLRRQLLWMYQEKRRTLQQILEYAPDAS